MTFRKRACHIRRLVALFPSLRRQVSLNWTVHATLVPFLPRSLLLMKISISAKVSEHMHTCVLDSLQDAGFSSDADSLKRDCRDYSLTIIRLCHLLNSISIISNSLRHVIQTLMEHRRPLSWGLELRVTWFRHLNVRVKERDREKERGRGRGQGGQREET